ncbi:MAG: vWA domain-containing protein [Phycisphaerales bacterium]
MRARKLISAAGMAAGLAMGLAGSPAWGQQTLVDEAPPVIVNEAEALARIDVVFVLDTTGSMSGLIEGAKAKIWAIANQIATAEPRPEIRMGLVGYRDRGDDYVTKLTPLTDDLDAVYADLMRFEAGGGGDGPESVNQALHEAVHAIDWGGSDAGATLRLIYLVGDAPPHMDYEQDTPYAETCKEAVGRGIIINAIQCGVWDETSRIWREVAAMSEGEYFAIEQSGGVAVIETPFDEQIAELNAQVRGTMLDYGDATTLTAQMAKRQEAETIDADAAPAAAADRARYLYSRSGEKSLYGEQELVSDVQVGRVKLEDVPEDQLPESMRSMTPEERATHVAQLQEEREKLVEQIRELDAKRAAYITDELAKRAAAGEKGDGFDAKVGESVRRQAARVGIRLAPEG